MMKGLLLPNIDRTILQLTRSHKLNAHTLYSLSKLLYYIPIFLIWTDIRIAAYIPSKLAGK